MNPYWTDDAVTLHLGDCLEVLAGMGAASVDAVVTDPPYGLEFMGREWDTFRTYAGGNPNMKPQGPAIADTPPGDWQPGRTHGYRQKNPRCRRCGKLARGNGCCKCPSPEWDTRTAEGANQYQAWCEQWAAGCLRVLKPGGHLLAFGGTRTWHRLVCAIEDAGFEIRDCAADLTGREAPGLMWVYGCLSADTEILTERGWKPGIDVVTGEQVAQWDAATDAVTLAPVQQVFRAPWDGPLRVLRNADTDQLLTPNHRVYHQPRQRQMTGGVRRAWYDGRWQVTEAGALSTWNPVRLPVAGEHDGPGIGGEDYAALLGWVWTEGGFDLSGTGVRVYQSSVNPAKVAEIAALMDRLGPHKRYDYQRSYRYVSGEREYTATTWFMSGDLAGRVRADLPGKRPTYPLLWRMTAAEKRAFLRAAMLGDGSGHGTVGEQFYQQYEDDLIWLQTLLALTGRSGKVGMRGNRPGGALYLRKSGTTELQAQHLRDTWQDYTGEVWCVRVPAGAFLARRNGRVFITGNSGFPKSLDVSKAIDKAAGAEREVIGANPHSSPGRAPGVMGMSGANRRPGMESRLAAEGLDRAQVTAPATEDAARWEGWGTALKPAWEPIVVARKPLAGNVAQNVLEHGTGVLNIDGCRVAAGQDYRDKCASVVGLDSNRNGDAYGEWTGERQDSAHAAGRWPPNVLLGPEAAAELDRQSGNVKAGGSAIGTTPASGTTGAGIGPGSTPMPRTRNFESYGDSGGASRFFPVFRYEPKAASSERPRGDDGTAHPTVKPVDLMAWLVRLVTPPGGLVLDPFAGSGTTAEACIVEGFRCVLIEKDPAYAELIRKRLRKDIQPAMFGDAS